jgi:hypothetical protein
LPKCEIILFGNDDGVEETAKEFNLLHIPEVEKNELGTPILSSAFRLAQKIARNDILVYINADIILTSDFVQTIQKNKKPQFLMSGRRWDLDVNERIDFNNINWENELREKTKKAGKIHGLAGMDYFVFPRQILDEVKMPEFIVGRQGYDSWLIYKCRYLRIPVIDATKAVLAIHQNHNFLHSKFGNEKAKRVEGPELVRNIKLAGGFTNMCTLRDADWVFTKRGLEKPPFPRKIFPLLTLFYPWQKLLTLKRKMK